MLRLSIPPSLSDELFVPIIAEFQRRYPKARVHAFVTERHVDLIADGVDLAQAFIEVDLDPLLAAAAADGGPCAGGIGIARVVEDFDERDGGSQHDGNRESAQGDDRVPGPFVEGPEVSSRLEGTAESRKYY